MLIGASGISTGIECAGCNVNTNKIKYKFNVRYPEMSRLTFQLYPCPDLRPAYPWVDLSGGQSS